jgi:hypothetical protein
MMVDNRFLDIHLLFDFLVLFESKLIKFVALFYIFNLRCQKLIIRLNLLIHKTAERIFLKYLIFTQVLT